MSYLSAVTKRVQYLIALLIFSAEASSLQAGNVVNPLDWERANSPISEDISGIIGWEILEGPDGTKSLVLNEGLTQGGYFTDFQLAEGDRTRPL